MKRALIKIECCVSDERKGKQAVKEGEPFVQTCNLLPEAIENILSRLPVKPIIQFRCVSKQWQTLLTTDSIFVAKHLSQAVKNEDNFGLILKVNYSNQFYYVPNGEFEKAVKPHNPITEACSLLRIVGSLNGIICLCHDSFSKYGPAVCLWNPSTREYKTLPCTRFKTPRYGCRTITFGFMYHPAIDDYKVVRLVNYEDYNFEDVTYSVEVEVYSLSKNTWKRIGQFIYYLFDKSPGTNTNGSAHWLGSRGFAVFNCEFILAFDMYKEVVREIPLPDKMDRLDITNICIYLRMFRGCLSLFFTYNEYGADMDLWVMNKYGMKESWTKNFTFTQQTVFPYPVEFLKNGELLVQMYPSKLASTYSFESKEYKEVQIRGVDKPVGVTAVVYVESLVPLNAIHSEAEGQHASGTKRPAESIEEDERIVAEIGACEWEMMQSGFDV